MKIARRIAFTTLLALLLTAALSAQVKKTPRPVSTPAATPAPTPEPSPIAVKKNGRPADTTVAMTTAKSYVPEYFYEFTRPGFMIPRVVIEHDAAGKGTVTFLKSGLSETISDPLQLTPVTLRNIDETLQRLNFLDSVEEYQYAAHDFSNMGNITFRYVHNGRSRSVKYNWTENKDAKFLMDEYRRIGNEAVWNFETASDRVIQPLDMPRQMDALDSYLQRDEISDPPHLIPLLKELANDERLPLIARNHATRLIARIQRPKK